MKKILKYLVPYWLKKPLKTVLYTILDCFEFLAGKRPKNYPPRRLNFVGSVDFKTVGEEFRKLFVSHGGLKPNAHILDIGCGVGRMALPLVDYVNAQGSYLGFDIVKKGIEWCQKNITPRHPNFQFVHANIANKFYNEKGTVRSEEYLFPAKKDHFNFCFATSVFTHMLPAEVEHYFEESSRVMAKGGTIFFTFFLIPEVTPKTSHAQNKGYETHCINFQHPLTFKDKADSEHQAYYSHKDCPEAEIGYPEQWIHKKLKQYGFTDLKVYPGKWKDPQEGLSYQDIVVATRM